MDLSLSQDGNIQRHRDYLQYEASDDTAQLRGADSFALLRRFISNLRKQHQNILAALNSVFRHQF